MSNGVDGQNSTADDWHGWGDVPPVPGGRSAEHNRDVDLPDHPSFDSAISSESGLRSGVGEPEEERPEPDGDESDYEDAPKPQFLGRVLALGGVALFVVLLVSGVVVIGGKLLTGPAGSDVAADPFNAPTSVAVSPPTSDRSALVPLPASSSGGNGSGVLPASLATGAPSLPVALPHPSVNPHTNDGAPVFVAKNDAVSMGGASSAAGLPSADIQVTDSRLDQRLSALEEAVEHLTRSIRDSSTQALNADLQQAQRLASFEANLVQISAGVAALKDVTAKPEPVVAKPAAAQKPPAPKVVSTQLKPKPAQAAAREAVAKEGCTLRGATDGGTGGGASSGPATAWLQDGKGEIGAYALGATAPCVGRITSIRLDDRGWVVTGASGVLRQ